MLTQEEIDLLNAELHKMNTSGTTTVDDESFSEVELLRGTGWTASVPRKTSATLPTWDDIKTLRREAGECEVCGERRDMSAFGLRPCSRGCNENKVG